MWYLRFTSSDEPSNRFELESGTLGLDLVVDGLVFRVCTCCWSWLIGEAVHWAGRGWRRDKRVIKRRDFGSCDMVVVVEGGVLGRIGMGGNLYYIMGELVFVGRASV